MTDRRLDLIWVVLAVTAMLLGVWLGMTAADISPVFTQQPLGAGGPGR